MRLNTATSVLALAVPRLINGFYVASRPAATRTATSLAARRSMMPILRRIDIFSPDINRIFDEMDEMMESSLATRFPRQLPSLSGKDIPD